MPFSPSFVGQSFCLQYQDRNDLPPDGWSLDGVIIHDVSVVRGRNNGCSAMLLTITNTKAATELGYLLHKNTCKPGSLA